MEFMPPGLASGWSAGAVGRVLQHPDHTLIIPLSRLGWLRGEPLPRLEPTTHTVRTTPGSPAWESTRALLCTVDYRPRSASSAAVSTSRTAVGRRSNRSATARATTDQRGGLRFDGLVDGQVSHARGFIGAIGQRLVNGTSVIGPWTSSRAGG